MAAFVMKIGHRCFTDSDQAAFAEVSGDANPLHMDPIVARRTLFGERVVHGVHGLLWALDRLFSRSDAPRALMDLDVDFEQALGLGSFVDCTLEQDDECNFAMSLARSGVTVTRIRGSWRQAASEQFTVSRIRPSVTCEAATFAELSDRNGTCELFLVPSAADTLFPALGQWMPPAQLAAILAMTRLVGMQCPGLHSIFVGAQLRFHVPTASGPLAWRVAHADRRMSVIDIAITSPGVTGTLRTLFRPPPHQQPTVAEVAAVVSRSEFASQRALIVGGCRGLGEVVAKIIAAGGGRVCLTYHLGAADAERLCADISGLGAEASAIRLDVTSGDLPRLPWTPSHLYFFATPRILPQKEPLFSDSRFELFARYYVHGFARIVTPLLEATRGEISVLYPSTVFLDQTAPQFTEYCAAKAAGEALCHQLARRFTKSKIHTPRLPRMRTDQTASLVTLPSDDALGVMLSAVRALT